MISFLKDSLVKYFVILGFFVVLYLTISFVQWAWVIVSFDTITFWCRFSAVSAVALTALERYFDVDKSK